jgi:hypothetical protein
MTYFIFGLGIFQRNLAHLYMDIEITKEINGISQYCDRLYIRQMYRKEDFIYTQQNVFFWKTCAEKFTLAGTFKKNKPLSNPSSSLQSRGPTRRQILSEYIISNGHGNMMKSLWCPSDHRLQGAWSLSPLHWFNYQWQTCNAIGRYRRVIGQLLAARTSNHSIFSVRDRVQRMDEFI